ncbi:MAG: right-handed parallel beta-helix repeat-containing protein [Phycisphaerales bacterium]
MPYASLSLPLSVACVAVALASTASAAQHLVRAGDDWSKLKDKVQPGDDIVLMPGTHRGAVIEGLAGEEGKPISIRPADLRKAVLIEADDTGIVLKSPRHVRIEAIAVAHAKRSGIVIEGTPTAPAEDVLLRSVYVAKTGDRGDKDAIRIENAKRVTLDKCRIEAWHRAGVHVRSSRDVTISGTEWVGGADTPDKFGVAIDGGSFGVTVDRARFKPGVGIAVAIGIADTDVLPATAPATETGAPLPALAESVTVERCLSDRVERFAAIGACRGVTIRANTVVSSNAVWEVAATPKGWCDPTAVTIIANLIVWEPGTMQQFSVAAPGSAPKGVAVEANLWWSPELSAARQVLGDFVGTVKSPQITDRDPKVDNYFRPREESAKAFGTEAP